MNQAQFRAEASPSVAAILGIMFLVGLGITIHSIRCIIKDRRTNNFGTEAYGIIADIMDFNFQSNHTPHMKAYVLILSEDGTVIEMSQNIGTNRGRYRVGDYVRVKYLENNLNILHRIKRNVLVPADVELLEHEYDAYSK